VGALYHML